MYLIESQPSKNLSGKAKVAGSMGQMAKITIPMS